MTANELRRELSARNRIWAEHLEHDATYGNVPCIIHAAQPDGSHGNFLPASWRRIQARASWRRRLEKAYTSGKRIARSQDRWRGELEAATSSGAASSWHGTRTSSCLRCSCGGSALSRQR